MPENFVRLISESLKRCCKANLLFSPEMWYGSVRKRRKEINKLLTVSLTET